MVRRFISPCIAIVLILVLLIACFFSYPRIRRWYSFGVSADDDKEAKELLLTWANELLAYKRLMKYILNPATPCEQSALLGGVRLKNKKLDGDKLLCLKPGPGLRTGCLVYSFGVNNEWSFEEKVQADYGCQVHAFDPSSGANDHLHSKDIWFYNMGIAKSDYNVKNGPNIWSMRSFSSILKHLGHTNRTIDVLKMDIEGAEFEVLENMLQDGILKRVNHMCIEIHLLANPHWQQVMNLLKRIDTEAGLKHFSTRNNTQTKLAQVPGFYARQEQHYFELSWYRK